MPESSLPPVLTSLLDTPVPEPLKAVAGLAAVALEEARHLPQRLLGLPVAAAGQAMQASMRVQQRYAELVAKGDEVIGALRRGDETPAWATFDEDEPATAPAAVTDPVADLVADPVADPVVAPVAPAPADLPADEAGPVVSLATPASAGVGPGSAFDRQDGADNGTPARRRRTSATRATGATTATKATGPAKTTRPRKKATAPATSVGGSANLPGLPGTSRATRAAAKRTPGTGGAAAPVEGYDALTLPQLRARVKGYDRDTLEALLTYERAHGDRAPYVTMLVKRLDVVAGD